MTWILKYRVPVPDCHFLPLYRRFSPRSRKKFISWTPIPFDFKQFCEKYDNYRSIVFSRVTDCLLTKIFWGFQISRKIKIRQPFEIIRAVEWDGLLGQVPPTLDFYRFFVKNACTEGLYETPPAKMPDDDFLGLVAEPGPDVCPALPALVVKSMESHLCV